MTSYFDILKNVCTMAHEDIPSSFSQDSRPYAEIKKFINDILEEVCSKFAWTFIERTYTLLTEAGKGEYSLPDGISTSCILKKGVRIENALSNLDFVFYTDLDNLTESVSQPYLYSAYSGKLILYPAPDKVYNVKIRYLTNNYAVDSTGTVEKPKLELETDKTIIPERFIKVLEWGVYALYRQSFKPDNKYTAIKEKYLQYLLDMQKAENCGYECSPFIVIGNEADYKFFNYKEFLTRTV